MIRSLLVEAHISRGRVEDCANPLDELVKEKWLWVRCPRGVRNWGQGETGSGIAKSSYAKVILCKPVATQRAVTGP